MKDLNIIPKLIILVMALLIASACNPIKETVRERTVTYDTVDVKVTRPAIEKTHHGLLEDTLHIEDPNIEMDIIRMPPPLGADSSADSLKVDYRIKRDTVYVPMPQKTITETETNTVVEKETPFWNWLLFGALGVLVLAGAGYVIVSRLLPL